MKVNTTANNKFITGYGQSGTVYHYVGTGTVTYDDNTERPLYSAPNKQSVLMSVFDPSKQDIKYSGGKVTLGSKKVVMPHSTFVGLGDELLISSFTGTYIVDELIPYSSNKVVIVNLVNDSLHKIVVIETIYVVDELGNNVVDESGNKVVGVLGT